MPVAGLDEWVARLLAESLSAWRVAGAVRRDARGALLVMVAGKELRITRAAPGLPFRWMVDDGERARTASSVTGLLRHVRTVVDPAYRQVRLRIAPLPLALP
ncbi:MAG TPA: hypothetical protein VJ740_15870 [Hyphomicrobiaceae bacterium]|jgi:hypothetical protein|nr:hypothetical protein [Hyphomicrobiaceae bacterium]